MALDGVDFSKIWGALSVVNIPELSRYDIATALDIVEGLKIHFDKECEEIAVVEENESLNHLNCAFQTFLEHMIAHLSARLQEELSNEAEK